VPETLHEAATGQSEARKSVTWGKMQRNDKACEVFPVEGWRRSAD